MLSYVWYAWLFWAVVTDPLHPFALYGLLHFISISIISCPLLLVPLALLRLLSTPLIKTSEPISPLLRFVGLALPCVFRSALDIQTGQQGTGLYWLVIVRKYRGRLYLSPIFGSARTECTEKAIDTSDPHVPLCNDLKARSYEVHIGSFKRMVIGEKGWTVRDILIGIGLQTLLDENKLYVSQASRVIPLHTKTSNLLSYTPLVVNFRMLGGTPSDKSGQRSVPMAEDSGKSLQAEPPAKAANVNNSSKSIPSRPVQSIRSKQSSQPQKKCLLSIAQGGSGDGCRFFNPARWPTPALKALAPLVLYSGEWDEDMARRCIGDMHQAWLQYQTPGYRSDLEKVSKYVRTSINWNRPMTTLEALVGYAGPAGTGPKELQRPMSFAGVIRWIERVYKEERVQGRGWIKASYRHQFDSSILLPATSSAAPRIIAGPSLSKRLPDPIYSELAPLQDDASETIELEDLPKSILQRVDETRNSEDPEITLDRLQVLLWKEAKIRALAEGKEARLPNTPGGVCAWNPRLFHSEDIIRRDQIISTLRSRLFRTAWNDQRSFSTDRNRIEELLDDFIKRVLEPKTDEQLRLIQYLPDLMVTPELLMESGLSTGPATDQSSVIYIKMVTGGKEILDALKSSCRQRSRQFGGRIERFIQSPPPQHLHGSGRCITGAAQNQLYFSHVGRFTSGAANRSWWEHQDLDRYDAEKGGRVWVECCSASGVIGKKMIYYVLADHTLRTGGDWCNKMAGDELFFSTLFLNPFLTIVAWPGTALPDPPAFVGEKISNPSSTEAWLGKATLARAAVKFRCDIDPVSLICLQWLGWKGYEHPNDWLTANRETIDHRTERKNRWFRLISAYGEFIPVPWTRTPMGKTGQMHEAEMRLYVSTPLSERAALTLRPAGVDLITTTDDLAPHQRALSLSVDPGSASQRSLLYDMSTRKGTLDLALVPHPSYIFPDGSLAYTLQDKHSMALRNGTSSNFAAGASVTIRLTNEASMLLNGQSVPYQDCTDLAIWPDVVRRRLAQTGHANTVAPEPSRPQADAIVKSPVSSSLAAEWVKMTDDLSRSEILLRNSLMVTENEDVTAETQNPVNRGYNQLLDERILLLKLIRQFILDNEPKFDLSTLSRINDFRPK